MQTLAIAARERLMRGARILLLSAVLLGPALGASAQMLENVVFNGEFHGGTNGWFVFDPSIITWSSADHENSADSGSMLVTNPDSCRLGTCFIFTSQCIPVLPQDTYDFGAFVFIFDQPGVDVVAEVALRFFGDTSCSNNGSSARVSVTGPTAGWVDATQTAELVPPNLQAIRVELACGKMGPEDLDAECLFDSVFALPEPGPIAAGCAALASVLLLSRRRRISAQ